MALRTIPRSAEEMNLMLARYSDSRSEPAPDHADRQELQEEIRQLVIRLGNLIDGHIEPCRESSVALTHLNDVQMWANKAVFA